MKTTKKPSRASRRVASPCWRIFAGAALIAVPFIVLSVAAIRDTGWEEFVGFIKFISLWGGILLCPVFAGVWLITSNNKTTGERR